MVYIPNYFIMLIYMYIGSDDHASFFPGTQYPIKCKLSLTVDKTPNTRLGNQGNALPESIICAEESSNQPGFYSFQEVPC